MQSDEKFNPWYKLFYYKKYYHFNTIVWVYDKIPEIDPVIKLVIFRWANYKCDFTIFEFKYTN